MFTGEKARQTDEHLHEQELTASADLGDAGEAVATSLEAMMSGTPSMPSLGGQGGALPAPEKPKTEDELQGGGGLRFRKL